MQSHGHVDGLSQRQQHGRQSIQVQESFFLLVDAEAREEIPAVPSVAVIEIDQECGVLRTVLEDDMREEQDSFHK